MHSDFILMSNDNNDFLTRHFYIQVRDRRWHYSRSPRNGSRARQLRRTGILLLHQPWGRECGGIIRCWWKWVQGREPLPPYHPSPSSTCPRSNQGCWRSFRQVGWHFDTQLWQTVQEQKRRFVIDWYKLKHSKQLFVYATHLKWRYYISLT